MATASESPSAARRPRAPPSRARRSRGASDRRGPLPRAPAPTIPMIAVGASRRAANAPAGRAAVRRFRKVVSPSAAAAAVEWVAKSSANDLTHRQVWSRNLPVHLPFDLFDGCALPFYGETQIGEETADASLQDLGP